MKRFSDILNESELFQHDVPLIEHQGELTGSCTSACKTRKSRFSCLNEHRGEPDPEKVRQRQEAHQRGEERRKNAQQRRKEEQKARLEKARAQLQFDKQKTKYKTDEDLKRQQKLNNLKVAGQNNSQTNEQAQQKQLSVKQRLEQIKNQQDKQQQIKNKQDKNQQDKQQQIKQNQQKKEQLQTSANEKEVAFEQEIVDIQSTAPTESTKDSMESLTKDVKEINNSIKTDLEKEVDDSKRAEKKKEIEEKYNKALEKAEKNLKTSEEKSWMQESAKKVFEKANAVFDAWWELFGFKDITEPVKDVSKKYLGIDLSLKNKLQKAGKEADQKAKKKNIEKSKKTLEELGKNKEQRLKELKKQGYSDIEAQEILADVMQRRTNSDNAKQWKEDKQKNKKQDKEDQQLEELQKQHNSRVREQAHKKQQKQISNSNYTSDLKNAATDAAGKKYVNDRIRNRDKIIKEKMKDGYSRDVAEKLWYKETKNNL